MADSFARSAVTPLPWETARVRAAGLIAWYVGMPRVSSRVMSATRVTPARRAAWPAISSVAAGSRARSVPGSRTFDWSEPERSQEWEEVSVRIVPLPVSR